MKNEQQKQEKIMKRKKTRRTGDKDKKQKNKT